MSIWRPPHRSGVEGRIVRLAQKKAHHLENARKKRVRSGVRKEARSRGEGGHLLGLGATWLKKKTKKKTPAENQRTSKKIGLSKKSGVSGKRSHWEESEGKPIGTSGRGLQGESTVHLIAAFHSKGEVIAFACSDRISPQGVAVL